jgi:hypothetical protein
MFECLARTAGAVAQVVGGPADVCVGWALARATANTAFFSVKANYRLISRDFHAKPFGKIAAKCGSTELP